MQSRPCFFEEPLNTLAATPRAHLCYSKPGSIRHSQDYKIV
jgi:hypothetical protein